MSIVDQDFECCVIECISSRRKRLVIKLDYTDSDDECDYQDDTIECKVEEEETTVFLTETEPLNEVPSEVTATEENADEDERVPLEPMIEEATVSVNDKINEVTAEVETACESDQSKSEPSKALSEAMNDSELLGKRTIGSSDLRTPVRGSVIKGILKTSVTIIASSEKRKIVIKEEMNRVWQVNNLYPNENPRLPPWLRYKPVQDWGEEKKGDIDYSWLRKFNPEQFDNGYKILPNSSLVLGGAAIAEEVDTVQSTLSSNQQFFSRKKPTYMTKSSKEQQSEEIPSKEDNDEPDSQEAESKEMTYRSLLFNPSREVVRPSFKKGNYKEMKFEERQSEDLSAEILMLDELMAKSIENPQADDSIEEIEVEEDEPDERTLNVVEMSEESDIEEESVVQVLKICPLEISSKIEAFKYVEEEVPAELMGVRHVLEDMRDLRMTYKISYKDILKSERLFHSSTSSRSVKLTLLNLVVSKVRVT